MVKNPSANAQDASSIPGSGRSPGGGHGNPLQCSCLENPEERGAWWATVLGSQRAGRDLVTDHSHSENRTIWVHRWDLVSYASRVDFLLWNSLISGPTPFEWQEVSDHLRNHKWSKIIWRKILGLNSCWEVNDPLWGVDFSKLRSQDPDEVIAQRKMEKDVEKVGRAWFHPEFIPTPGIFARPCGLSGPWMNAMPWLRTGKHSGPPLKSEFVCDSRLRASSVFLPFLFPWSLGGGASPLTVWLQLREAWVWCVYFVGIHFSFWWLVTLPRCL